MRPPFGEQIPNYPKVDKWKEEKELKREVFKCLPHYIPLQPGYNNKIMPSPFLPFSLTSFQFSNLPTKHSARKWEPRAKPRI
jgi:hypothetical protein